MSVVYQIIFRGKSLDFFLITTKFHGPYIGITLTGNNIGWTEENKKQSTIQNITHYDANVIVYWRNRWNPLWKKQNEMLYVTVVEAEWPGMR